LLEEMWGVWKETQLNQKALGKLWSWIVEAQINTDDLRTTMTLTPLNCSFRLLSATRFIHTCLRLVTLYYLTNFYSDALPWPKPTVWIQIR
jgi:hypothetical protein